MTASEELSPEVEFSRPVEVDSLAHGVSEQNLQATAAECAALKERFAIDALNSLSADLRLVRSGSDESLKLHVSGHLNAELSQTCVVSLEPFDSRISCDFETAFDTNIEHLHENLDLDLEEEDPPEPIVDGIVDLGELVAQSLSLEIDPHPRKPGVESDLSAVDQANRSGGNGSEADESPFAVLRQLKLDNNE